MKLYYDPCTVNCRKVLAGYDLMGVKYDTVKIDYFTQGQKSPEYLAVNPNGSLPALDDGGFKLWESNAMLQYAADQVGAEAYYPKDPKTRADIHRWHLWEASAWFPSCYVYLVENVVKPLLKAEPDQKILDAQAANFHLLFRPGCHLAREVITKAYWLSRQHAARECHARRQVIFLEMRFRQRHARNAMLLYAGNDDLAEYSTN